MAKFACAQGEGELFREEVDVPVGRKMARGTLIATNRRVVLLTGKPGAGAWSFAMFGILGGIAGRVLEPPALVTHEIERENLAEAQVTDRRSSRCGAAARATG